MSAGEAESKTHQDYVIALNTAQTEAEIQAVATGLRAYNVSKAGAAFL